MENILSGNPLLNYAAQSAKGDLKVNFIITFYMSWDLNFSVCSQIGLELQIWLDCFLSFQQVKRRWDDDVVFKNCARSEPDKKKEQFINDSLRSEFHRKFMEKYVK